MEELIHEIKSKLQNFDNNKSEDLFFLIGSFKHLEKLLTLYIDEELNQTFKIINKILANAFNQNILEQHNIFELLQEILYIEKFIKNSQDTISDNDTNSDTLTKVAIGLGLGALGFVVGKAFADANRSSESLENNDILTVAYYLSRYDHTYLFNHSISATKAIENIAKILKLKPNTLRNKRDYFDAFLASKGIKTNSQRNGYQNAKLSKQYDDIINQYKNSNEEDIRTKTIKILNQYSK
jgi:hypothetical protein